MLRSETHPCFCFMRSALRVYLRALRFSSCGVISSRAFLCCPTPCNTACVLFPIAPHASRVTRARLFPRPCQKLFSKRSAVSLTLSGGSSLHWELPGGDLLHRLLVQLFLARAAIFTLCGVLPYMGVGLLLRCVAKRRSHGPGRMCAIIRRVQSLFCGKFCDVSRSDAVRSRADVAGSTRIRNAWYSSLAAFSVLVGVPSQAQG